MFSFQTCSLLTDGKKKLNVSCIYLTLCSLEKLHEFWSFGKNGCHLTVRNYRLFWHLTVVHMVINANRA